MSASRHRPKGALRLFGLFMFVFLMPTTIGYQDLASLMARQPAVSERWRQHVLASPFGTIHAATFSFPQPIGTSIPEPLPFQLASFDPRSLDITGSIPRTIVIEPPAEPPLEFPTVDRTRKGDLLVPRPRPQPDDRQKAKPSKERDYSKKDEDRAPGLESEQQTEAIYPPPLDPELTPGMKPAQTSEAAEVEPQRQAALTPPAQADDVKITTEDELNELDRAVASADTENPAVRMARLYFGADAIEPGTLQPWADGEAPTLINPQASIDPDIKRSALDPKADADSDKKADGESVAPKGEVTGEGRRPKTPAERLGLAGASRAKHERCLADAIYYESRGELEKGQMAVAQVVMNRVFSGKYPDNVCGVVYQDSNRYLRCQFTFACEGKRLVIDEPDAWETAKRIARDTLDGKLWVPEVGKSTHYHAYWVRPSWVNEMKRMYKFGVHTFYRPRAWGDGSEQPSWGSGATPVAPQANATPEPAEPSAAAAKL